MYFKNLMQKHNKSLELHFLLQQNYLFSYAT